MEEFIAAVFLMAVAVLAVVGLISPYDSSGEIQNGRRAARKKNRYRRKHDLPYGAQTPFDDE